jgi:ADP-heptose:LPS heptosyltransferase
MIEKFGPASTGMGDILLFTSIFKYFPNKLTFQLPKEKEKYSILFQGLANIEIIEKEKINILHSIGYGHYATALLRNFFNHADILDNRPLVLYTDKESEEWADDFLKKIKNPIIICPVASERTGGWENERSFKKELTLKVIQDCRLNNLTPILHLFKNIEEFDCCLKVPHNLNLEKYICLLRKCGRFIGCNTGDMHLAISLGCLCTVMQPKTTPTFDETQWSYSHPSITYYNF